MDHPADHVERIRGFNRDYTRRLGLLTDRYLGQDRPLGEARLLFEIDDRADVRDLRARLDLDSGYLSRLLRSLEKQGLVRVAAHPEDGRVRVAELTTVGARERRELDDRARAGVAGWLEHLTVEQRDQLVAAQQQVDRLLRLAAVRIEPVNRVDGGFAVARQCLRSYAAEIDLRFPEGYDSAALITEHDVTAGAGEMFVALDGDRPAGCCAWRRLEPGVGEVRHMWVAADHRGFGLARRLLHDVETDAAGHGITTLRLYTHSALPEASALYRSSGYTEIPSYDDSPYSHFAFEKAL